MRPVIQGVEVADNDKALLDNSLSGETAVRIAPESVLRAVEQYKRNRAR